MDKLIKAIQEQGLAALKGLRLYGKATPVFELIAIWANTKEYNVLEQARLPRLDGQGRFYWN